MKPLYSLFIIAFCSYSCYAQNGPFLNVRTFGATGDNSHDDTEAFQKAIDSSHGQQIYIPSGTYRIARTLHYKTTGYSKGLSLQGDGENTVINFDFADGTPLFLIDGSTNKPYQFQRGGYIHDIMITAKSHFPPKSQGDVFNITGWSLGEIKGVIIRNCNGNGIVSPLRLEINQNPDAYATAGLNITMCELSFLDGVAIAQLSGVGCGGWRIISNRIGECKGGGIIVGGHNTRIESNAIFSNGLDDELKPGIAVQRIQTNPMGTYIANNELDNNALCHILLNGSANTIIQQNRMNSWETVFKQQGKIFPPVHVLFSPTTKGAQNINAEIKLNYHRSQYEKTGASGNPAVTLYYFKDGTDNGSIHVNNFFIPKQDNTPNIRINNLQLNRMSMQKIQFDTDSSSTVVKPATP